MRPVTFVICALCAGLLGACGRSDLFAPAPDGAAGGSPGGLVPGDTCQALSPPPSGPTPIDPERIDVHRLNNFEYDNTMRDLLGVDGMAQTTFPPDQQGEFDNDADQLTIDDRRSKAYFDNADRIGEEVFADTSPTGLLQRYVYGLVAPACTPSATDTTCSSRIIAAFGAKAWRRPLTTDEVQGLQALATNAINLGQTADGAIKQVVKTMLASPSFLNRIEEDADPTSMVAHPISQYEMASRLSYLVWSSMPDQTLFDLASQGQLLTDAVLTQQVDRMLADPKGANFTTSFAGQWLGARDLQYHQVEPTAFPSFDEALRAAFITEALMYFDQFLTGPLPMTQFLTNTNNFVNARLAQHYGFGPPAGTSFQMVKNGSPARVGFMGLGSFLTFTSYSYRTSPVFRGKWILLNLFCQDIPVPPANEPTLDQSPGTNPATQQEDVRALVTAYSSAPDCSGCHRVLDPIGLGLENFDAIGASRTKYSSTSSSTIDTSATLATGETFNSLPQLAKILSQGSYLQQLTNCASRKMMTYALGHSLSAFEAPYLEQIRTTWACQGYGLKDLMKDIVTNHTFKFRRGQP